MQDEKQELTATSPEKEELPGGVRSAETARVLVRLAKRAARRKFAAEEKVRIVLEGVRGELPVAELCRREGIHPTIYYKWLKDFMEAGKARMRGDALREASTGGSRATEAGELATEAVGGRPEPGQSVAEKRPY
jgi:transposase-like protein